MPLSTDALPPRSIHLARLLKIWRSAGWPCKDAIELDLLSAGWIEVRLDCEGRETLRLTQSGMELLTAARHRRSRSSSLHDQLATRMCTHVASQGRIVWRELGLRAQVTSSHASDVAVAASAVEDCDSAAIMLTEPAAQTATASVWRMARPDVFSIRNTSVAQYLHPIVHEIKVSRADLLADLRDPAKREAYRSLSCETYYVFPVGLADAEEIPAEFGIWTLRGDMDEGKFELVRPAHHAPCTLSFSVWMTLAKSTPVHDLLAEPVQGDLTAADERS